MNPQYTPVENPALLPMVVRQRPRFSGLSADYDGDAPNFTFSEKETPWGAWAKMVIPLAKALASSVRGLFANKQFMAMYFKAKKEKRMKNKRRRRKSKANRRK